MNIAGSGIILKTTKFQESSLIITLLSESEGIIKGLIKTYNTKRQEKFFVGDFVSFEWSARLKDHLGFFKIEGTKKIFPNIINEKIRVHILESATGIIDRVFKEDEQIGKSYVQLESLLKSLISEDIRTCLEKYLLLELAILQESGYGLDFSKCVATNSKENLAYISPRSGGAVSLHAGEQYKNKLFNLPSFLKDSSIELSIQDVFETLKITEHFLNKFLSPYIKCEFNFRSSVCQEIEKIIDKAA